MNILLAPDSFKECLTAREVCAAMADGIADTVPGAEIACVPMADGGEGTLDALRAAREYREVEVRVSDPLGRPRQATYLLDEDHHCAIVESAQACALSLVPVEDRNPLRTSTRGVGELLMDALEREAGDVVMTLGGSGTIDGGAGMALAMGYRLLDQNDEPLPEGGGSLQRLERIELPDERLRLWAERNVEVMCDVSNPLLGERGAVAVFGRQKGATDAMMEPLENGLFRLSERIRADLRVRVEDLRGAGAAGGLGAGLAGFAGARLRRGIDIVIEHVGLEKHMEHADLVITGEGRTDRQTLQGKVCMGVAELAHRRGVPCVILSGAVESNAVAPLKAAGAVAVVAASDGAADVAQAICEARERLADAAARIAKEFGT